MIFGKEYFLLHYRSSDKPNIFKKVAYRSYVRYLFRLRQGTLLDCGCGIGNFLLFAEQKYSSMGFDISDYAVFQARTRTKTPKLWVASASNPIPLRDQSVDVVTAFDIVEHLPKHEDFFGEVNRVLCSEGIFLIRTPNLNAWVLQRKGQKWFAYRDETHIALKQKEYWCNVLQKACFDIIDLGTDLVWDAPIFTNIPLIVENSIFRGSKFMLQLFAPFAPVGWGDNLIIVSKKNQSTRNGETYQQ